MANTLADLRDLLMKTRENMPPHIARPAEGGNTRDWKTSVLLASP